MDNADDDEDIGGRPQLLGFHEDNQVLAAPVEVAAPEFAPGRILKIQHGDAITRVLCAEDGRFFEIGRKKGADVHFGSVYEGWELLLDESRSFHRRMTLPDLHIQIFNHHTYWVEKAIGMHNGEDIMRELSILQYIQKFPQHPNIARLEACLMDDHFVYCVMENGGEDVLNCLQHSGFNADVCKHIFCQLLDAFQFLQSIGVYHRDVSPENVLYNTSTGLAKVIDFGMALVIPRMTLAQINGVMQEQGRAENNPYPGLFPPSPTRPNELVPLLLPDQGWLGKPTFAPPEMYARGVINGFAADNWSLGVLLFVMLTKSKPWLKPLHTDNYFVNTVGEEDGLVARLAPTGLPASAKQLLRRLLRAVNPLDRLKIHELREVAWLLE